ncbi:Integration host factor subunit alpha [anaerobic digester metagenome]
MNQRTLINTIWDDLPIQDGELAPAEIERVLRAFGRVAAAELLAGFEVPLPGLGRLVAVQRKARSGRNPRTGQPVRIAARMAVVFRARKDLKDALKDQE